jgi:hypothetical protein
LKLIGLCRTLLISLVLKAYELFSPTHRNGEKEDTNQAFTGLDETHLVGHTPVSHSRLHPFFQWTIHPG